MDTKDRPIEEKISKPAGRWRNRYKALAPLAFRCGRTAVEGEILNGIGRHPSKDIAESYAEADRYDRNKPVYFGLMEYLGAFPEGQDAP